MKKEGEAAYMKCDQDSPWRFQIVSNFSSTYYRVKIFSGYPAAINNYS